MKMNHMRFVVLLLGVLTISLFTGCMGQSLGRGPLRLALPPGYKLVLADAPSIAPPPPFEAVRVVGGSNAVPAPALVAPAAVVPKPPVVTDVPPVAPALEVNDVISSRNPPYQVRVYNPLKVPVTLIINHDGRKFEIPAKGKVTFRVDSGSFSTPYEVILGDRVFIGILKHVVGIPLDTIILPFPAGIQ